jgi:hypothetical protein
MISWTIKSMSPEASNVKNALTAIFNTANTDKNNKINIPPLTLSENGRYVFTYTFTNFLNK